MKEYPYRKMNEMREILEVLQMPSKLKNTRTILTLLAGCTCKRKIKMVSGRGKLCQNT